MYTTSFNTQKSCVQPTLHLCVLLGSKNKQRLFTALTDWFYNGTRKCSVRRTDLVFNSDG